MNTEELIDPVEKKLSDLERFIARRFDEISMEIEATSQLIDMAEEDAGKRFQDMLGMLHAISFTGGDGSTPANSGTELEAVVKETEVAASKIMDCAENIKATLDKYDEQLSADMQLATLSESIFNDAQAILLACSFQDLISQRVTTSLKNIRAIEERLSSTLSKFGIDTQKPKDMVNNKTADDLIPSSGSTSSQNDIDALFS